MSAGFAESPSISVRASVGVTGETKQAGVLGPGENKTEEFYLFSSFYLRFRLRV